VNSISLRFALASVSMALLILALIGGVNYYFLKEELLRDATVKTKLIEQNSVHQIQEILTQTKRQTEKMIITLKKEGFSKENIAKTIKKGLQQKPYFYGMAMAFEPHVIYNKPFCPYYYKHDGTIIYKDTSLNPGYNYTKQQWYTRPKKGKKGKWSEPYFDEGGGEILMATYGDPVFSDGKFAGVITIDISLKKLEKIISSVHILKTGYAFLLSKDHKILVHPDRSKIMTTYPYRTLTFNQCSQQKNSQWVYYAHVASTGLILGITLPENELFASLNRISLISAILAIIGSILLIITMILISRRITRPLKEVTKLTEEISLGDFDKKIALPKVKDEIYYLSRSVNRMQDSIKKHMNELKNATIKEERIESELNIAHSIQMSMMPKPLPENPYVETAARLKPAKAVGGDFYDYFYLNEEELCFVIADVSGKGVPAAIFMAVTMSYLRAYDTKRDPAKFIHKLNNSIASKNDANMFVTLFMGILEIKTGEITYVNAGHTAPYFLGEETGIMPIPSTKHNPVVGAFEDLPFENETITLKKGQKLFLYTDGVTEAFSKEEVPFGEERLEKALEHTLSLSAEQCVIKVKKEVSHFCEGAEQSDDITLLVIERK